MGLKERQVGKIMSGVKHHFDINTKSTSFLAETVVTSMKKAIKPTTSEIRAQAIESAEHVKLPLPDAGIDLMHARDWDGVDWDWSGTSKRAVSLGADISLIEAFRASNVVTPGPNEEDHAVRYSDIVFLVQVRGDSPRRVIVGEGLAGIKEENVQSVTSHVYSTKVGKVPGDKVPYTLTRDTELSDRVVTKMFLWCQRMVQSPLFNINDHLCTVYRADKNDKWHRRCTRRSDLTVNAKDTAEACGIPRQHAASSSFRKTAATLVRLGGGDDKAVAARGRWALGKNGRSAVASNHYDLACVTGRGGTRGETRGLSVQEVLNMLPLSSVGASKGSSTKSGATAAKVPKTKSRGQSNGKRKRGSDLSGGISPKKFNPRK